jgi:hypothetical protein
LAGKAFFAEFDPHSDGMADDPRFQARFDEIRTTLLRLTAENRQSITYYKWRWAEDRGDA